MLEKCYSSRSNKTVHKIFHPSKPEIAWAKKVCSVYEKSTKKGKGATVS